jgi:hypothetical protein
VVGVLRERAPAGVLDLRGDYAASCVAARAPCGDGSGGGKRRRRRQQQQQQQQ